MLGAMVVDVLVRRGDVRVAATVRTRAAHQRLLDLYPEVDWRELDAEQPERDLPRAIRGCDGVINAIGITKPRVKDDNDAQVETAIRVNGLFPRALVRCGVPVLQIATDCVYSGAKGRYVETDLHDATDVYGKTKSLGEAHHESLLHLRCSIVGPEPTERKFLLEWLRGQSRDARLPGYVNHEWNGVTTLHFARLAAALIAKDAGHGAGPLLGRLQHVIPADVVSKHELLRLFAAAFDRPDLSIAAVDAPTRVDRTLSTLHPDANAALWRAAGYDSPPTIARMVAELAADRPRFSLGQG